MNLQQARKSILATGPRLGCLIAVLGLAALAATGCGAPQATAPGHPAGAAASGDPEVAPDFTLDNVEGQAYSLASSQGQVLLLDFWATWCPPCRDEIPMLQRLHEEYGADGLTIVGISDEDGDTIRKFLAKQDIDYVNLIDPGSVAESYGVLALPTGILIDRGGRIVERFFGPKPEEILEARIRELLELPST